MREDYKITPSSKRIFGRKPPPTKSRPPAPPNHRYIKELGGSNLTEDVTRKTIWDDEILKLERRLLELREYQSLTLEGEKQIKIGTVIVDTEEGIEMRVSKLRSGSNDFEAHPVDDSSARKHGKGYSYLVRNWRVK